LQESGCVSVFVSYSRKDIDFVRRLHAALADLGRETWVDWEGIPPTADWMQQIAAAIDVAQAFVFVISPDSLKSAVCADELEHAVRANKRLVPILLRPAEAVEVPSPLARLNWVMFRSGDDFDAAVRVLIEALDVDLEWVEAHTRLLVRAREWEARGHSGSLTLRGEDLKAAEQWLSIGPTRQPPPNELQTRFILESRRVSTRRRAVALGATSAAVVVIAAVGLLWLQQREQAQRQEANALGRRLASIAERQREAGATPEGSLQLLAQALQQEADFDLRSLEIDMATRRTLRLAAVRERRLGRDEYLALHWKKAVAFRPDGQLVAAGESPTFEAWSIANGEPTARIDVRGEIKDIVLDPDGDYAIGEDARDGSAMVWRTTQDTPVLRLHPAGESLSSAALSAGGRYAVVTLSRRVAGSDRYRTLLLQGPLNRSSEPREIPGLPAVHWPALSADGNFLAGSVGEFDAQELHVWSMERLMRGDVAPIAKLGRALFAKFSPDSTHLAAMTDADPHAIVIWSTANWEETSRLAREGLVALGFGGNLVATQSAESENVTQIVATRGNVDRARLYSRVQRAPVAFSADGRLIAVGGDGGVDLWRTNGLDSAASRFKAAPFASTLTFDSESDALIVLESLKDAKGKHLRLRRVEPSTGQSDGSAHVYELRGDSTLWAVSGNGRTLAYASGDELHRIDTRSGAPRGPVLRHPETAVLALDENGDTVAAATASGRLRFWREGGPANALTVELGGAIEPGRLALTGDGKRVVAVTAAPVSRRGQQLSLQVRDLSPSVTSAPTPLGATTGGLAATLCGISPAGRLVAINDASALRIYDLQAERDLAFVDEVGGPRRCAFSADERWLAVTGVNDMIGVWDLAAQAEVARLEHMELVTALAFSRGGRYLATLEGNGTVTVWLLQPKDLLVRVCESITHDLSAAEWDRLGPGRRTYRSVCGKPAPGSQSNNDAAAPRASR
jgi:WD40 repeat protein